MVCYKHDCPLHKADNINILKIKNQEKPASDICDYDEYNKLMRGPWYLVFRTQVRD